MKLNQSYFLHYRLHPIEFLQILERINEAEPIEFLHYGLHPVTFLQVLDWINGFHPIEVLQLLEQINEAEPILFSALWIASNRVSANTGADK